MCVSVCVCALTNKHKNSNFLNNPSVTDTHLQDAFFFHVAHKCTKKHKLSCVQ